MGKQSCVNCRAITVVGVVSLRSLNEFLRVRRVGRGLWLVGEMIIRMVSFADRWLASPADDEYLSRALFACRRSFSRTALTPGSRSSSSPLEQLSEVLLREGGTEDTHATQKLGGGNNGKETKRQKLHVSDRSWTFSISLLSREGGRRDSGRSQL